jgi:hypothetical protein
VYLVNHAGLSSALQQGISARMDDLFKQTLTRAPGLGVSTGGVAAVAVRWVQHCPQGRSPWDVVIAFELGGGGSSCRERRTRHGTTWRYHIDGHTGTEPAGVRSVVYVPDCGTAVPLPGAHLGSVAFHELMHNKLQLGNGLHTRRTMGHHRMHHNMSRHRVGPATPLNDDEVRLLAPHLGDTVPQACH